MKTFFVASIIAVFLFLSSIGIHAQPTQTQTNQVVIGSKDIIYSKILNEQREIWVYVPSSASDTIYLKQRYPVVYLLDGDWHFTSVVGMIQQLSSVNGNTICPEMIVVGIPNTDRTRDLTSTHIDSYLELDSTFCKNSGGGENFISFIEKELMPHIDSLYPTAPYRTFVGHSFGGLTVMNTLIHHTNLFKAYIAIEPSMWWDNQKLLKEARTILTTNTYSGVSLYLGIANTMDEGMDTIRIKEDTTKSLLAVHMRSLFELRDYLNNNNQNQLNFSWRYYNNDNHTSVPLIAEYDALHAIFYYYPLKLSYNDKTNVNQALISKIENHFENVSKQMGYKVKPPEFLVYYLGCVALNSKHFDEAIYLFKLNVSNYPDSWVVYDAMGDYYDAKGDKATAIDNYKKALSIKEIADTRQKLEKLQGK
jgi:uncharacterized protein